MDIPDIEIAKQRIWARMNSKLPDRGLSPYQGLVTQIRSASSPAVSRLQRVQYKEHLLDSLPDRNKPVFAFKRLWGLGTLMTVLSLVFMPILQLAPRASASSMNMLEVVEGTVLLNGNVVSEPTVVREGDSIETQEGAMAHIYFVDDSRMTLAPHSVVSLVSAEVNPENKADTRIEVYQESGRSWVQVLNLVSKESYFLVSFPGGNAQVDSRASFDLSIGEETRLTVARNIVDLNLLGEEVAYTGTLGQGAELIRTADLIDTHAIPQERKDELWWDFNDSYGITYAGLVDSQYKEEATLHASILPTNPLYFLKTFREDVQVSLAFSSSAKEELLVQQAENRLNEAQVLLAQGETTAAEEVLTVYHETVEEALENTDNVVLLAKLEETQKQVFTSTSLDESTAILEDHLSSTTALLSSSLEEKTEAKLNSASQNLERVPDLLTNGFFDQALNDLALYQEKSLSILTELESVPMEERESVVSALLDQKLDDIQMLRIIASMPEASESMPVDTQILEQMSMMVLSLKEEELNELATFFESTDYDVSVQYNVYTRLKNNLELDQELSEQFETVEAELENSINAESEPLIEIEELTVEESNLPSQLDPKEVQE